ncbi:hypothetical protein CFP56_033781 [Quercus suber]|uniref:NB-ARC domain-containing protein n=1 Tax=Quercus suber TaxID=58331 RepID=A0AAW0LSW9_QUESU
MNAKAIEGIKHSRMACTNQLKEIIKDAGKSLKSHGESSCSKWSENQKETESQTKFKEIGRFKTTLRILEIYVTIFRVEQRRERNSVVGMDEDEGHWTEATNKEGKEKDYSIMELNGFLKVLDNILSVEALESLKAAFRDSTNGSRILITTRHKSVASNAEHYY